MQVPPEIAFREIEATDGLKTLVLEGIEELEKVYPNLISCRTMVADDTPGQRTGGNIRVRLDLSIPGKALVVEEDNSDPEDSRTVERTLRDAFDVARRRLQRAKERQRGDVKVHELPPHGRITRLLVDDTGVRYGFIESDDGRRVYFHEDALVDMDYDELEIGDEVRIAVAAGDQGPQASTVAPFPREDVSPSQEKDLPLRR